MLWQQEQDIRQMARPLMAEKARARPDATVPTTEEYWQREMLMMFAHNQLRVGLVMPVLALLLALGNLAWISAHAALGWLALYLMLEVALLLLARRCLQQCPAGQQVREWMRLFAAGELAHAAIWLFPLFLFWREGAVMQHMFIGASLMAAAASRILVANNFLPLVLVGNGAMTLAIAARAVFSGEMMDMAMAGMILVLGVFFTQLARRLQKTTRDMLAFRAQRERLIAELQAERDAAERARRQAEAASRAKSRFLAAMSHELRTPLNAIMGFSEIIASEFLGPVQVDRYREYASDIHRSGSYLLNLIEDILDLSRIEAGRVEMKEEVVSMQEEARRALELVALKANARRQKLRLEAPEEALKLRGNGRYIRQMWINLLGNAVKFTPEGGEIVAAIRRLRGGNLALEVRDNGEGIPAEELETVMQSFARGASAVRKAVDGAGLGLAIVNGLARLHDARLEIESEVGKGTVARVVFPARRVITQAWADFIRPDDANDELEHQLILLTA